MLGTKLDDMVQYYISKLRERGGVINSKIVISSAKGILLSQNRTSLSEFGGHITLTVSWAKSLLRRMNFTKRRGTTKARFLPEQFKQLKASFLQEIIDVVTMEDIPAQLIFNWDQTGLNLVPVCSWTMAEKGSKRVETKGLDDKRQITGVFCGTLVGEFLPIQLIYAGKTARCHPSYEFPADWDVTHTPNHWSNEATMLQYIDNVIAPFVSSTRDIIGKDHDQAALAIFDHFSGQLTPKVMERLEYYNIHSVIVPACCTDRLQPLDISVNKAAKSFLQSEFQKWYADKITQQLDSGISVDDLEPVDTSSAPFMKSLGAKWMSEHFISNPSIVVNGFFGAGIQQSIDACKPFVEVDEPADDKTESDEIEIEENYDEEDFK